MTREHKHLLLITLCGMLPYGVVALKTYKEGSKTMESTSLTETDDIDMLLGTVEDMEEAHYTIRPYLRPMSSMTEEEFKKWRKLVDLRREPTKDIFDTAILSFKNIDEVTDWLNSHHFDYRGLIEKGLALEAPEDMYKTE